MTRTVHGSPRITTSAALTFYGHSSSRGVPRNEADSMTVSGYYLRLEWVKAMIGR